MKVNLLAQKINLTFIFFLFISVMVVSPGCKKEGCTDPNAENYDSKADDDDGSCVLERAKFIGTFAVTETCTGFVDTYDIMISQSSVSTDRVNISNFYGSGLSVSATVEGDIMSIDDTVQGATITGDATINGNTLTMNFQISDSGYLDTCTATGIKK